MTTAKKPTATKKTASSRADSTERSEHQERTEPARGESRKATTQPAERDPEQQREHHDLRLTIPLDRVADVARAPVAAARTMLPAKGGVPLYLGLAGLAVAGVVEWPVAAAAGVGYAGYAVLHRNPRRAAPGRTPPTTDGGST